MRPRLLDMLVPQVTAYYASAAAAAASHEATWNAMFAAYAAAHPALAAEFQRRFSGKLPEGWMSALPRWKPTDKADATR
jgi:transketolase